ncbi:hypothetical protein [Natronorarus salvus]|uniref:hypothetical protein n=1 Tax=Natronorarus salvus TaxID=3117733 RepID=UPI002F26BC06
MGEVKAILATGHVDTWYPITHILVGITSFWVGIETSALIISFVTTIVFILFVSLAIRSISSTQHMNLCFFVALPLPFTYFHTHVHPAFLSTIGLPVLFYLIISTDRIDTSRNILLTILILAWIIIGHPVTGALAIVFLVSVIIISHQSLVSEYSVNMLATFVIIAGLLWVAWYSSFESVGTALIGRIIESTSPTGQTTDTASSAIAGAENPFVFLFQRIIEQYGAPLIPIALAFLLLILSLFDKSYEIYTNKDDFKFLVFQIAIGIILSVTFFVVYLSGSNPIRIVRYTTIMSIITIGFVLVNYHDSTEKYQSVVVSVIFVGMVLVAIIGVFSLHPINYHMSHMEHDGIEYTIEYHDSSVPIRSHDISSKTYRYILGTHQDVWPPAINTENPQNQIPPNLGVNSGEDTGAALGESYIITQQYILDRSEPFGAHQQDELSHYNENDIARLGEDPTVAKLYGNGETQMWKSQPNDDEIENQTP